MINARPLLKKRSIYNKRITSIVWRHIESRQRGGEVLCGYVRKRKGGTHYQLLLWIIQLVPSLVCITLSLEMVSREGGIWGRNQKVEEQLEEQGGRTRQLEEVSSLISKENSEILIDQRTNLTRSYKICKSFGMNECCWFKFYLGQSIFIKFNKVWSIQLQFQQPCGRQREKRTWGYDCKASNRGLFVFPLQYIAI